MKHVLVESAIFVVVGHHLLVAPKLLNKWKDEYTYTYGAVCPWDGIAHFLILPNMLATTMELFLIEVASLIPRNLSIWYMMVHLVIIKIHSKCLRIWPLKHFLLIVLNLIQQKQFGKIWERNFSQSVFWEHGWGLRDAHWSYITLWKQSKNSSIYYWIQLDS